MSEKIIIKEQPRKTIKIHEEVRKVYPELENLIVRARAEKQVFEHKNLYGYDKVTVEPIEIKLQDKEVLPSYDTQKIIADNDYDGLREVIVNPIVLNLQSKEVTPNYAVQEVTADNGYDALEKVTVKAKTGYDTDDADAVASDIVAGKIAYGKDGKIIGSMTSSNNAYINTISFKRGIYSKNIVAGYAESIKIDISNVVRICNAFQDCLNLKSISLIGSTSKFTDFSYAFYACYELETIPNIDTSNATDISCCFYYCSKIKSLNLNTAKVTNMAQAFRCCANLEQISELDCSSVNVLSYAFHEDGSLKQFGGLRNLGKNYTSTNANYFPYTVNLSASNQLEKASILNILNGLYDLAANNKTTQSLILGTTNLAKLTAEEIAIATNKGWNVS